jgi:SpoVK/Ycf46/Vps4 family AAA+-type ATPase
MRSDYPSRKATAGDAPLNEPARALSSTTPRVRQSALSAKTLKKPRLKSNKRVWVVSRYEKQRASVAEALGDQLHLPVKRIDLSQVVSRYIGETEKNLARVFAEAEGRDWLLFFDEADALFGRRTGVKDAHDRYANPEMSYFLNRLENSTASVVVAARRKHSLDPAFMRRLRMSVVTPLPLPKVRAKRRQPNSQSA